METPGDMTPAEIDRRLRGMDQRIADAIDSQAEAMGRLAAEIEHVVSRLAAVEANGAAQTEILRAIALAIERSASIEEIKVKAEIDRRQRRQDWLQSLLSPTAFAPVIASITAVLAAAAAWFASTLGHGTSPPGGSP